MLRSGDNNGDSVGAVKLSIGVSDSGNGTDMMVPGSLLLSSGSSTEKTSGSVSLSTGDSVASKCGSIQLTAGKSQSGVGGSVSVCVWF